MSNDQTPYLKREVIKQYQNHMKIRLKKKERKNGRKYGQALEAEVDLKL